MAEQTFKGLLQLNSKPYTVAQSENKVLRAGEPLAVTITGDDSSASETVTMLKIGDGTTPFNDLPWLSGLASDVYDWALQPEKPTYSIDEIKTSIVRNSFSFTIKQPEEESNDLTVTATPTQLALIIHNDSSSEIIRIAHNSVSVTQGMLEAWRKGLGIKDPFFPADITATEENQIMLSDSSLEFQAVNLIGTDYSTIRPRGTRIVSTVDEAANTPEGCFSAVIGG